MAAAQDPTTTSTRHRDEGHSSRQLVDLLLDRIAADAGPGGSHAVLEVNPDAQAEADRRDTERTTGRDRGPLHGLPVLVKDNVDTAAPMHTTAGSAALRDGSPLRDATVVTNLREAGLVVLGKTNLSEWANYRSTSSVSGWSAVGGLTTNPHDPRRSAGGSSSGSAAAVALDLAPFAVGTETDGSIICPAAFCGVVGLKPTHGLVPADGVVPISASQDTVGPMARTVRDAALLLAAMLGEPDAARLDPAHEQTGELALMGLRIGLPRAGLWSDDARVVAVVEQAVAALAALGATIVDPVVVASLDRIRPEDEQLVLDHELKAGLAAYLATRAPGGPRTLADLIAFNEANADLELGRFDQDIFLRAEATTGLDDPGYLAARARCVAAARTDGLDAVMAEHDLDLLAMPSCDLPFELDRPRTEAEAYVGGRQVGPTALPAMAGYPMLSVPCGLVDGLPVGLGLVGKAGGERVLLRVGHVYETTTFGSAGSAAAFPPPAR